MNSGSVAVNLLSARESSSQIRGDEQMYVGSHWDDAHNTLVIDIGGTFTYALRHDFKQAYARHDEFGITIKINMGMINFMDSAALGMLIELRKFVQSQKGNLVLVNPRDTVLKILQTAHFDRLFNIVDQQNTRICFNSNKPRA